MSDLRMIVYLTLLSICMNIVKDRSLSLVEGDEVGELLGGGGISRGLFIFRTMKVDVL